MKLVAATLGLLLSGFTDRSIAQTPEPSCAPDTVCAANDDTAAEDADEELEDVVVTGARPRGAVRTPVPPETRVERTVIRALGADNLDDVLGAFAPQAQTLRGGGEPVLLVNGRRIADRSEIESIPPEAIRELEIFPEEVALQYGYAPDRRVVNIILRRSYHALELQANSDQALGDGRSVYRARTNFVQINPAGRLNPDLGYRLQESLRDEDAGTGADERTRLPRTERLTLNATFARELDGRMLSANGNGQWRAEDWRLGRGNGGLGLERRVEERSGGASLALNGGSGNRQWSIAGKLTQEASRIVTREGGMSSSEAGLSVRGTRTEGNIDLTASSRLGPVPGGDIEGTISTGFALRRHDQRDLLTFTSPAATKQDSAHLAASLDVPVLVARRLAVFGEGGVESANRHDLLGRYGGGLRSMPAEGLTLSASYSHARSLPDFADLAGTGVSTPNVRVYDFLSGAEQMVLMQEGGNPDLKPAGARTISLRAQVQPFADRDLSLTAEYSDLRMSNAASGTLGPTPQVEAALPERFARDPNGTLTAFDSTPANVARQHRRQLRSGINLTTALGEEETQVTRSTGRLQFAMYHTWTMRDEARLRPGTGLIDLLDGAAIGNRGGTSRHSIEAQFGFAGRRFGLRLAAQWRSATHVDDLATPDPTSHRLAISPGATLDARMFVNLKPVGDTLGLPWLKGRMNLSVDNVLGTHSRIRNENGDKVNYYQGSGDAAGRTIRLSFRKVIR